MSLQNQSQKLVELGFIYCLKNPLTEEIFYVGATESAPKDRLAGHYSHFKEYLKGKRKSTKKFEYFESIFPEIAKIELLEIVQNDYLYQKEVEYIKEYSEKFHLMNQTFGGEGGDTFIMQDNVNKHDISKLISEKAVGKKKPEGFAENLSKARMGSNNPMAGKTTMKKVVILKNDEVLKVCTAPFEITEFLDSVYGVENHKLHAGRVGNITKAIRVKENKTIESSGFTFKAYEACDKEIQDIVDLGCENNLI